MAQRWYSCHLDHQTVVFGPKGRTGPSPGVVEHIRCGVGGLGQRGGALHHQPFLPRKGWVEWHGGGWVVVLWENEGGVGATNRLGRGSVTTLDVAAGARRPSGGYGVMGEVE